VLPRAAEESADPPQAPSLRTHEHRTLSFNISIKKEGTLTMIVIDMSQSRISSHPEYHLKVRLPWIHKSWPCKSRCSRKCLRSIRNRRTRSNKKNISKRSAGRPNNILKLRDLVTVKEQLGLYRRTQRDSLRVVRDQLKTISSHQQIKVVPLLTSISTLEVEQARQATNPRRLQAHLRLKK
jgi:hypothetical protein